MRSVRRALAGLVFPAVVAAQGYSLTPRVQPEARLDGLLSAGGAVQAGAGANVPAGLYARIGVVAAAGMAWRGGRRAASGRFDGTVRWLLDPFGEFRWGPYAGAGLSVRYGEQENWRGSLLVLLGVEGRAGTGWRTAVEAALGNGVRIGVVFRRARQNGR